MPRTAKTKSEEKPISILLKLSGQDSLIETTNILNALRELSINPKLIKSRATFEVTYNGKTYRRILNIIQTKRLLTSDLVRKIIAKSMNNALGITVDNYE